MTDTPIPSLGRNTAVMAMGTVLSRVTGFGRLAAIAYALGVTRLNDTYVLAYNTPYMLYELALGGVLAGTVLPVFVRALRSDDEDDGWRAISAVWTVALVAGAVLAVAFVFVAPLFIRLYTARAGEDVSGDQLAVATLLLRLFAPQVFFLGLISLSTALLNAHRRFAAPMFTPILNNLVVIAVFVAYPALVGTRTLEAVRGDTLALLLLGLGTTAGVVANALAQTPFRMLRQRFRWTWEPGHPAVRTIARLGAWTVAFAVTNQVALFFVYFLANGNPGDVTAYFYAFVIFLLPHAIVSVSVMTAAAPELSEAWDAGDRAGFRHRLTFSLGSILAVTVPAAAGYLLLADPIAALLLQRGAVGPEGAEAIGETLALMALALPAYSSWLLLTRAYQAIQDTRSLFFLYLVENGVNVVAAFALYPTLGVEGLALALAIAYSTGTIVAMVDLRRRTGGVLLARLASTGLRVAAAAVVMGSIVFAASALVGSDHGLGALVRVGVGVGAGVTVYLIGARLMGIEEMMALLHVRRRA